MPIFNNLIFLELESLDLDCVALLKILQNSVCLETLCVREVTSLGYNVYHHKSFHIYTMLAKTFHLK
jgi:hypothetical protein